MFTEKTVLKNFAIFTDKHLCRTLFEHGCFSLNTAKFLRTPILENIWVRMVVEWVGTGGGGSLGALNPPLLSTLPFLHISKTFLLKLLYSF